MYTLTYEDIWLIGQMHYLFQHDCHVSPDDGCDVYGRLETAYTGAKDEQVKRKLAEIQS
jgi:hypothetical protein